MTPKPQLVYIGNKLQARGGTPTTIDVLAPLLREEGFVVKTASSKKNRLLRLYHMLWVVFSNRNSTDFVLIDTYSTMNFWYAWIVALLCQRFELPYIPLLHGGDLPRRLEKDPEQTQAVFGKAYLNIAPSHYLKQEFEAAGFKVKYIPNSISIDDYEFLERRQFKPNLLWVRSFTGVYNPKLALEVFQMLLAKYPEANLTMVGPEKDGSMETCKTYAEAENLPVKFTGRLEKKDWINLSTAADIFINTANTDNTPVSVLEAMALGLPVVSTKVGGIPFLLEDKVEGILVPPNDPQRMASAIEEIMKEPEQAAKMAFLARKKAETFDWELVKEEWRKVLNV